MDPTTHQILSQGSILQVTKAVRRPGNEASSFEEYRPESQEGGLVHDHGVPPRPVVLVGYDVVLLHVSDGLVYAHWRLVVFREGEVILQDMQWWWGGGEGRGERGDGGGRREGRRGERGRTLKSLYDNRFMCVYVKGGSPAHLVDLQCDSGSRYNDLLDTVHVSEHPLVVRAVGPGIAKEHAIEPVHEIVATGGVCMCVCVCVCVHVCVCVCVCMCVRVNK